MTEYTSEHLEKMLGRVQALLARAEHPNTPPPEAETARMMAEQIMVKYRIEEETARQERIAKGTAAKPVVVEFMFNADMSSAYRNHYYSMMFAAINHVGVRGTHKMKHYTDEETGRTTYADFMVCVGFDSDVQTAELIYTNMRLAFSEKLEPKIDRSMSDADNIYRLRSAGIERIRIAKMMWNDGSHANNAKVTKLYNDACRERGEDPRVAGRSVNAKTYRESYADAFVSEIASRLRRMKMAAGEESGAIVLAGRQEAVDEAFYEQFPHLRPKATLPGVSEYKPCEKCKRAKSGRCRDHSYRSAPARPFSSLGWGAGTNAARETDLSRAGNNPRGRLNG